MTTTEIAALEYLFGIWQPGEDGDGQIPPLEVVAFRVIKKTAKRIFYVGRHDYDKVGSVNRQQLEETGEVWNRSRGWWSADYHLHAQPPEVGTSRIDVSQLKVELARLRAEMAAVHPDRGGTDADFIAAHRRYATTREIFARFLPTEPDQETQ
jgi:hypothetical protein